MKQSTRGAKMDKLNKIMDAIEKTSKEMKEISSGSDEGWKKANQWFAEYQKQNKRSK